MAMSRPFRKVCAAVPPFTVQGQMPNGDPKARRALAMSELDEGERDGSLRDCWALAQTASAVSRLHRDIDMEDENMTGPIDARALISAIDNYRYKKPTADRKDRREQTMAPLDVTMHLARVVERLLLESGNTTKAPGPTPMSYEAGRERADLLVSLVSELARQRGLDLEQPGPATAAHRAAMERHMALPD